MDARIARCVEMRRETSIGIQVQGPIVVIPYALVGRDVTVDKKSKPHAVPDEGMELCVTRGYSHRVLSTSATWAAARDVEHLAIGVLDVSGSAYIFHPDYGVIGVGPGRYVVRRQRELTPRGR